MEIKVSCDCGQRYAFEVEPENGLMPVEISCPSCQTPGTQRANDLIAQKLRSSAAAVSIPTLNLPVPRAAAATVSIPPVPKPAPSSPGPMRVAVPAAAVAQAPAPVAPPPVPRTVVPPPVPPPVPSQMPAFTAPPPVGAPPPVPADAPAVPTVSIPGMPSGSRLKLTRGEHSAAPAAPAEQPIEDIAALMAKPDPAQAQPAKAPRKIEKVFGEPNMAKALMGAAIGATLSTGLWFGLWKATLGYKSWAIMAVGVGWVTGFFARMIGRSEGQKMGLAVMGVAVAYILGFQIVRTYMQEAAVTRKRLAVVEERIAKKMEWAKEVVQGVPNGTDAEIRKFIAGKDGNPDDPVAVAEDAVVDFRADVKEARSYTSGNAADEIRQRERQALEEDRNTPAAKIWFWVNALGIFSIVSTIGGAYMAYRFGSGEG